MDEQQSEQLSSRVLRRAQVGKMARVLQDSLALANVKCKNGWENFSIDILEPRLSEKLNRQRPSSSHGTISDSSSSHAAESSSAIGLMSSPITLPMFSDDVDRDFSRGSAKRRRIGMDNDACPPSSTKSARKYRSVASRRSWRETRRAPASSPLNDRWISAYPNLDQVSKLSFVSEASTLSLDQSPELSEEDDADLPVQSFQVTQSIVPSSPPRTPPPQSVKDPNISWSRTPRRGEEGADLLMFFANSPSQKTVESRAADIPATPPSKATPLPSSIMKTPGGSNMFGNPNTPSNTFNLADFYHMSPSPAQGLWLKTPRTGKTPLVGSSARRRLNFETPGRPDVSPHTSGYATRSSGRINIQLGEALPPH